MFRVGYYRASLCCSFFFSFTFLGNQQPLNETLGSRLDTLVVACFITPSIMHTPPVNKGETHSHNTEFMSRGNCFGTGKVDL